MSLRKITAALAAMALIPLGVIVMQNDATATTPNKAPVTDTKAVACPDHYTVQKGGYVELDSRCFGDTRIGAGGYHLFAVDWEHPAQKGDTEMIPYVDRSVIAYAAYDDAKPGPDTIYYVLRSDANDDDYVNGSVSLEVVDKGTSSTPPVEVKVVHKLTKKHKAIDSWTVPSSASDQYCITAGNPFDGDTPPIYGECRGPGEKIVLRSKIKKVSYSIYNSSGDLVQNGGINNVTGKIHDHVMG